MSVVKNLFVKTHHFIAAVLVVLSLTGRESLAQTPASTPPPLEASTTPILNDDWGHIHERYVADAKARAAQIQLVFLGDSITIRWTSGAGRDIWATRYAPLGAINLGISADGTQHVLWRLQHGEIEPLHPKMVLLMIGTNNLGETPDAVAYGVWSIVAEIRKTHPETRVLVEGIFPRADPKLEARIPSVNALLAKLDDGKMVKYIYFGDQFLKPDGTLNKEWFTDGTHPEKPEAFKVWADALQPVVDAWIKEPPIPNVPPPASPVPVPSDLLSSTPTPRNDWLFRFKRQQVQATKGNCDLFFLGGTTMSLWDRQQELFKKEYGSDKPLNFANWGSRTENILWELDNGGLTGLQPKVIVVQVQDNLLDNTPAANVAAGMEAITQRLLKLYPQSKVLLLGAFPVGDKPTDTRRVKIADYNTQLAKLADNKSVYFLDVGQSYIKPDGTLEPIPAPYPWVPDSLQHWADAQRATIAALMQGAQPGK
jgi:lysophospholipase L1-like esterase